MALIGNMLLITYNYILCLPVCTLFALLQYCKLFNGASPYGPYSISNPCLLDSSFVHLLYNPFTHSHQHPCALFSLIRHFINKILPSWSRFGFLNFWMGWGYRDWDLGFWPGYDGNSSSGRDIVRDDYSYRDAPRLNEKPLIGFTVRHIKWW